MHTRKILHFDLDAFFCAVEELSNPALRGKAFAVGGRPEQRGVVASCSYAARVMGVRSAMSMWQAQRLCPELIIVPTRHGTYSAVSKQVMARLHELTPLVEQVSIDEAYLEVTDLAQTGEALARALQQRIRSELDLSCSLGVATNKLMAKIGNSVGKAAVRSNNSPNAITVIAPGDEAAFLAPLPCNELPGVGPRTGERLTALGIHTIGDLARVPEVELVRHFGKHGAELWLRARGRDNSPIVTQRERKSVSQETTFVRDTHDAETLRRTLHAQALDVAVTLQRKQIVGSTIRLKIRWSDFTTLTRQQALASPTSDTQVIYQTALQLLMRVWDGRPVRLLGVGVSNFSNPIRQATLFDAPDEKREKLDEVLRDLRARFGEESVRRANEIEEE